MRALASTRAPRDPADRRAQVGPGASTHRALLRSPTAHAAARRHRPPLALFGMGGKPTALPATSRASRAPRNFSFLRVVRPRLVHRRLRWQASVALAAWHLLGASAAGPGGPGVARVARFANSPLAQTYEYSRRKPVLLQASEIVFQKSANMKFRRKRESNGKCNEAVRSCSEVCKSAISMIDSFILALTAAGGSVVSNQL